MRKMRNDCPRIYQPAHPRATKTGVIPASYPVVEEKLGRYLKPDECVFFKDQNKQNLDPENLVVCANNSVMLQYRQHDPMEKVPTFDNDGVITGMKPAVQIVSVATNKRTCEYCGRQYYLEHGGRFKYCSDECCKKARAARLEETVRQAKIEAGTYNG